MYSCFGIPRGPLGELATCYFAADAKYSLPLILFNDTGGVTTIVIDLTTFDVQNATVNAAGNGLIVTVNFIANTTATGCFIVLQSEDGSPDEFRALLRPESETTLVATIDSVPPSTYTMLFYDLEQDGLPNSNVAYERSKITVDGTVTDAPSRFLKSGSELFLTGTAVTVRCEFKEGIEGASCVLVYREYGNKILVVEEYPQNTVFPVTLTVDGDPEKYTYAIFGRSNSDFDGRPIVTKKFQVQVSMPTSHSKPEYPENEKTASQEQIETGVQADTSSQEDFVPADSKSPNQVSESDKSPLTTTKVEKESKYTLVETPFSRVQPTLPIDSIVQYQEIDIRTTHRMARCAYADLGPLPTKRPKSPKIESTTQGPYVDVLPHTATPDNGNGDKATPKGSPTVESVMSLLWGVAGRWKEIAEGLEFDGDLIDEIDTNNDMDEGCLQVCVEIWVTKLEPSWEKLSHVLKELGEVELARQAWSEVADASSQSTDFSGEMVPGVEKTVALDDVNNEDGSRGGKKMMPNDCSSGERGARSAFFAYPALHEEALTVSESCEEDEDTKCDVGTIATVESEEREKVTIVSGTNLFDFPYKPSLGEQLVPHDEPPPEPEENQPQPSPEETDSSQPLPPDPTPPQSQVPEVSPLQLQENNPPTPPPPSLLSREMRRK
ncbi:hypothetical protein GBAR_LOCUS19876 [Geodia barretti]|uniref:Death domain-containing protein n=1 Tax=Geodia barretti TaxID=519541 RepID=A0AA35SVB7_GEOBA|nr:hypothetical protein GBAR_LOCUS19876 [Geodia barretti]